MESSLVRIQTLKGDTEKQVNEHYRTKVQLQEQSDDNNWQMNFCQGAAEALNQMESFLKEGDLSQALLRLQSLRVQTYCNLSEHFKSITLLKDKQGKNIQDLYFYRGQASVNGAQAQKRVLECSEMALLLKEEMEKTDQELHFLRGMIASLDESERIVNGEINPKNIPSQVTTSPGVVGPNFEGQAMDKPDKVNFPDYANEYNLPNYSEYQPGAYQHTKLEEVGP